MLICGVPQLLLDVVHALRKGGMMSITFCLVTRTWGGHQTWHTYMHAIECIHKTLVKLHHAAARAFSVMRTKWFCFMLSTVTPTAWRIFKASCSSKSQNVLLLLDCLSCLLRGKKHTCQFMLEKSISATYSMALLQMLHDKQTRNNSQEARKRFRLQSREAASELIKLRVSLRWFWRIKIIKT